MPVYKILWPHKCYPKNLEIISPKYRNPRQQINTWSPNFYTVFLHKVLSEKEILYGWLQSRSSINFIALNYSLIIAKYHIFASSIRVGSLDFDSFLLRLKDKLGIIRSLAAKNKELDQFKETWAVLL